MADGRLVDASFFRGRRVLVTGHTGFKGAWLAFWLAELGAKVSGVALAPSTRPSLFDALALDRTVDSTIGDVRDAGALASLFARTRPEVVLHLAAQALVGESYRDPLGTFATNVVGTANVLDACRACDSVRAVVVVTSDKCYEVDRTSRPRNEEDRLGGHDPYSASKACAELVATSFRLSFLAEQRKGVATARAGNVIGGGDFTSGRLVPDCLAAFAAGRAVRLRLPDAVRPWQHVLEPLSGYLLLAQRLFEAPAAWSRAFNFGPDARDARPVRDVVERCARAWRGAPSPSWEREPGATPHETAVLELDSSLARRELGWRPAWNLDGAIERTVAWHRALLDRGDVASLLREQIDAHQQAQAARAPAPRARG